MKITPQKMFTHRLKNPTDNAFHQRVSSISGYKDFLPLRLSLCYGFGPKPSVSIIRRARAFRRHHRRAERALRRAARAKGGAFVWFLQTLQNKPADALRGFFNRAARHAETQLGVIFSVFFA
jgi:hypothetical protein